MSTRSIKNVNYYTVLNIRTLSDKIKRVVNKKFLKTQES